MKKLSIILGITPRCPHNCPPVTYKSNCTNRANATLPISDVAIEVTPAFQKSSFVRSSRRCAMLKDADSKYFSKIYIVCGYTDLCYGIDSLTAIIERKYHTNMFVQNTLFLASSTAFLQSSKLCKVFFFLFSSLI